jgi:hypothetical protein
MEKLEQRELHKLYSSPDTLRQIKSRKMSGWGIWQAWKRGETRTGFWWESRKGKSPLGRPRRRWEDGIKMDLGEIGWGGCGVDSPGSG